MKTYTVTIAQTDDNMELTGEIETLTGATLAEAKMVAKRNCGSVVTWTKEKAARAVAAAPKSWYYRGQPVELVEEVTNGYTLVNFTDRSRMFFHAVTNELEYR